MNVFYNEITVCFVIFLIKIVSPSCDIPIFDKCECGQRDYFRETLYLLNCTNTGFNNASILAHIPLNIEALVFTGNNIPELPWNVFGSENNFTKLRYIDMTNNNIKEIKGKSFHHVSNVERLILNHNQISISSARSQFHPRIFSNFENLKELHLTDAFEKNSTSDLAAFLHDIFTESNLKNLVKLHLEQNEIAFFKDADLFCELENLRDIYLGTNLLRNIDFHLHCLKKLRYIDLQSNRIKYLQLAELEMLDDFPARNQSLEIYLKDNPFHCGCEMEEFFSWIHVTKVMVRDKNKLKCIHEGKSTHVNFGKFDHLNCIDGKSVPVHLNLSPTEDSSSILIGFLLFALLIVTSLLIYTNRYSIETIILFSIRSLTRKVNYSSIGKTDTQEMEV